MNDLARRIGRVGVLYGGVSSEREISLASGYAVGEALQRLSIENTMIDVADNLLTQFYCRIILLQDLYLPYCA